MASAETDASGARGRLLVSAAFAGVAVVTVAALIALRPGGDEAEGSPGRVHADAACDLTGKAEVAAGSDDEARTAAALFLLDKAIIESERAAEADSDYDELDRVVQEVHTATHTGPRAAYTMAMEIALGVCDEALD